MQPVSRPSWWVNDLSVNTGTSNLKDGNWHHVVAVYSAQAANSDHFIYLDGNLLGQRNSNNALAALPENFRLGTSNGLNETFDGQLDEVAVFDYGLNAAEVNLLMAGDYGAFTNHLASFWTGPYGTNGSYNLYQVVGYDYGDTATWYDAHVAATNAADPMTGSGMTGHLVSIGSTEENDFVSQIKPRNLPTWIGLTDDDSLGGFEAGNDPNSAGWVWAGTTEPVTFRSFAAGQPDNTGDAVTMWQTLSNWDDTKSSVPGSGEEGGPELVYIIEWDIGAAGPISGARSLPAPPPLPPPVLPPVLPGPEGEAGAFGGIWVRDNGGVTSLALATSSLLSGTGTILTTNRVPVVNHHDPEKPGDINRVLFRDEGPYWANLVGLPDDHFATVYKGTIAIPSDGDYTFGVHSDDGFALRIRGGTFTSVNGPGAIDLSDPSTLYYPNGTGDSNTRGVMPLTAGTYPLEFLTWNGAGGAYHELYAAPGAHTADGPQFDLIGASPPGVVEVPGLLGTNVWEVWMTNPGAHGAIGNTNTAWNALTNYLPLALGGNQADPDGINKFTYGEVNFGNHGEPGGNAYPIAGNQHFALFARATMAITNTGTYVLGYDGDDGGWMRVIGQSWNEIVYQAVGNTYLDGDKMVVNQGTGSSRVFGTMDLTNGTYVVEMLNWQGAGGYHIEALNGVLVNQKVASALLDGNAASLAHSGGLQLVSPSGPEYSISDIAYDRLADTLTITWDSNPGASYRLVYSTDSSPGTDFDPATWLDLLLSIPSGGSETSVVLGDFLGTPWKDVTDTWIAIRAAEE